MNNIWIRYILVFILVVLTQGLVVNNIEINEYLNPMVYPMLVLVLPFETSLLASIILSFFIGLSVDAFSNTFGLHASSAMFIGYLRPVLLNLIKPRDGYDTNTLPTIHDMGIAWFIPYATLFVFLHHLWFFTVEILRFDLIMLILGKTIFSTLFSVALIMLLQFLLYTRSRK